MQTRDDLRSRLPLTAMRVRRVELAIERAKVSLLLARIDARIEHGPSSAVIHEWERMRREMATVIKKLDIEIQELDRT